MVTKFQSMADVGAWSGGAVLFLKSLCPQVDLLSLYKDPHHKFTLFKVIKLTLTDSAGGLGGYEILKLHDADPLLGVELKFVEQEACQRFLQSYVSGTLRQALAQHAGRLLGAGPEAKLETQLKAGDQTLDLCLDRLEACLDHMHLSQSARLRDDEMEELEQRLQEQALGGPGAPGPPPTPTPPPGDCFRFQTGMFEDRILTPADVHSFSNGVGRQWKHVGRALARGCGALKGPAIDNLAYEYEREGLYEQAYQMISRFTQAEGSAAKLGRLVGALEDCRLTGLAESLLGVA